MIHVKGTLSLFPQASWGNYRYENRNCQHQTLPTCDAVRVEAPSTLDVTRFSCVIFSLPSCYIACVAYVVFFGSSCESGVCVSVFVCVSMGAKECALGMSLGPGAGLGSNHEYGFGSG